MLCSYRCLAAVALLSVLPLVAAAELDPELPYQAKRGEPINHEIDFSVVVTPPYNCKVLKVWLPVPQTDFGQEIGEREFDTFPQVVQPVVAEEARFGNRFACFEFHKPLGAQIIRHRFSARVWNLRWHLEPAKVETVAAWPKEFARYLSAPDIVDRREFERVLHEIAPARPNGCENLLRAMDWIDKNLTYDHGHASLTADANHAFAERRGHCSDYHGLCATMGRALGYPTRVTYGLSLFAKNSPSHCRMEAFLPGYGWVSFDLSETQKLIKRIHEDANLDAETRQRLTQAARDRLRDGFRENCWLLMTKGTNYELAPKASRPVAVVRTAYIEADGEPLADPDPANMMQRQFSWMTVHKFRPDRSFSLPFEDYATLKGEQ